MKETLFEILERICEDDIVKSNPDIDLFETDLMDSLGFAELLADTAVVEKPAKLEGRNMSMVLTEKR